MNEHPIQKEIQAIKTSCDELLAALRQIRLAALAANNGSNAISEILRICECAGISQSLEELAPEVASQNNLNARKLEFDELESMAAAIFMGQPTARYTDLKSRLINDLGISESTSERRIVKMTALGIIKKDTTKLYSLPKTPLT